MAQAPSPRTGIHERLAHILCTGPVHFRPSMQPLGTPEKLPLVPLEVSKKSAVFQIDSLPKLKS